MADAPDPVAVWFERGGAPAGRLVLLISGADTPSAAWPASLLDALSEAGLGWVRFDHRDVGQSPQVAPGYDLHAIVADALDVLDRATSDSPSTAEPVAVLGSSLGAMVAQLLALEHPERVASLTLLIATATPGDPPPTDAYLAAADELAFSDEADDPVAWARLLAGHGYRFDPSTVPDSAPPTGHALAVERTAPWVKRLGAIAVPTLVVGGSDDPLFPPPHGQRLAGAIPGAELIEVDGLGHELPEGLFADLGPRLLAHLLGPS